MANWGVLAIFVGVTVAHGSLHLDNYLFAQDHLSAGRLPSPQFHTVDQDHFDGRNANQWQQAYYVNATFWDKSPDSPVFLCVGGEGPPLDGSVVVASVHCNVAVEMLQSTHALMFAVEHRYYGCHNMSACPVEDLDAPDALKFLSSRQALGDLAAFHAHATEVYALHPSTKWVTFGGSYPGMLAGWARLKFPHLFHASIASSAPVQAQVDMVGYNDVLANAFSIGDNNVGGSPECEAAIRRGHQQIGDMFASEKGREELAHAFKLPSASWLEQRANQAQFAGNGVAYFPAQGNDPSCTRPACNIGSICKIMTPNTTTEVQRLAEVKRAQQAWIEDARRAVTSMPDFWGYQTCTEFAFYQTCEVGSNCFFTQGYVLLADFLSECTSWNISAAKVASNVQFTNDYYGGNQPAGSRVLYPNGEVDPWHSLSVLSPPVNSPEIKILSVPGASHHAWTHPSMASDQKSVIAARQAVRSQVLEWLQED